MPTHAMQYDAVISTPFESLKLGIVVEGDVITAIKYVQPATKTKPPRTSAAKEVVRQLKAYFRNPDWEFSLPVKMTDTPFRQSVWQALQAIPSGECRTYGELAKQLGSSPRAIGGACRENPISIIVPCHRVVAAGGIGGYGGKRRGKNIRVKNWLLSHEHCA